jgi:hypothetical protein
MHSESDFQKMDEAKIKIESDRPSKIYLVYALIATLCFSTSGYILGIVSVNGFTAKYLNSYGYLISGATIFTINMILRAKKNRVLNNEGKRSGSTFPRWNDTQYYDLDKKETKSKGVILSVLCGAMNFGGELCVIFAFSHALDALIN